jgi:hypothetical protein
MNTNRECRCSALDAAGGPDAGLPVEHLDVEITACSIRSSHTRQFKVYDEALCQFNALGAAFCRLSQPPFLGVFTANSMKSAIRQIEILRYGLPTTCGCAGDAEQDKRM